MDIEDIVKSKDIVLKNEPLLKKFVIDLVDAYPTTPQEFEKECKVIRRRYKFLPRKIDMIYMYRRLISSGELKMDETLDRLMTKKLVFVQKLKEKCFKL